MRPGRYETIELNQRLCTIISARRYLSASNDYDFTIKSSKVPHMTERCFRLTLNKTIEPKQLSKVITQFGSYSCISKVFMFFETHLRNPVWMDALIEETCVFFDYVEDVEEKMGIKKK